VREDLDTKKQDKTRQERKRAKKEQAISREEKKNN
jgi:hypothetical protein